VARQRHLRVRTTCSSELAVLHLEGELDLATGATLEEEARSREIAAARKLLLDLRELRFLDSTGLRTILLIRDAAAQRGQDFAVTEGQPQVRRLLAITGVGDQLRVVATPEELLAQ
jgi:anti-anti-sigma factor